MPKLDWCDVAELIQAAIDLAADGIGENPVAIDIDETCRWCAWINLCSSNVSAIFY